MICRQGLPYNEGMSIATCQFTIHDDDLYQRVIKVLARHSISSDEAKLINMALRWHKAASLAKQKQDETRARIV